MATGSPSISCQACTMGSSESEARNSATVIRRGGGLRKATMPQGRTWRVRLSRPLTERLPADRAPVSRIEAFAPVAWSEFQNTLTIR